MRNKSKSKIRLITGVLAFTCLFASNVNAAGHFVAQAKVLRVLTDDAQFGGCMALIDVAMPEGCNQWVSFDCTGTYFDKELAENRLAAAMLALSSQNTVSLFVLDDVKHGQYCVARRIDVYAN